jgi:hypothetical protein
VPGTNPRLIQALGNLVRGELFVHQPAKHLPHHFSFGILDHQPPRTGLGLGEIGVAIGRLGHPQMALPRMEQATAPAAFRDLRPFILGKHPGHLL